MSVIVFFKDTAPAEIYPLPKNAALPIYHQQPVESQSDAAGGLHAVLERPDEFLVQLLCLRVARGAQPRLLLEARSVEHTSELQSQSNLVCRLLRAKKEQQEVR